MLKPSFNLVTNSIPLGLLRRKALFPEGRIDFKILVLKLVKLSELRMFRSSYSVVLFYSILFYSIQTFYFGSPIV